MREQMRQDMALAEFYRRKREQEDKAEREKQRLQVISVMAEVKREQIEKKEARRQKFAAEKRAIEEQQNHRLAIQAREKAKKEAQDEMFKRQAEEGEKLDKELAVHRAHEMRDTLVTYLNQSKAVLEGKRRAAADERRYEMVRLAEQAAENERKTNERKAMVMKHREQKIKAIQVRQENVSDLYAGIAKEKQDVVKEEERKCFDAIAKRNEEAERRAQTDATRNARLRSELVHALDEEISIQRKRNDQKEEEKKLLRRLADKESQDATAAAEKEKSAARNRQKKLYNSLSEQNALKHSRLMEPMQMKITSTR